MICILFGNEIFWGCCSMIWYDKRAPRFGDAQGNTAAVLKDFDQQMPVFVVLYFYQWFVAASAVSNFPVLLYRERNDSR